MEVKSIIGDSAEQINLSLQKLAREQTVSGLSATDFFNQKLVSVFIFLLCRMEKRHAHQSAI